MRPLSRADLPTLHRWRNDPAVSRHLARRKLSHVKLEAWFEGLERGDGEARAIIADGDFTGYGVLEHGKVPPIFRPMQAQTLFANRSSLIL